MYFSHTHRSATPPPLYKPKTHTLHTLLNAHCSIITIIITFNANSIVCETVWNNLSYMVAWRYTMHCVCASEWRFELYACWSIWKVCNWSFWALFTFDFTSTTNSQTSKIRMWKKRRKLFSAIFFCSPIFARLVSFAKATLSTNWEYHVRYNIHHRF